MTASAVLEICNGALIELGEEPLDSDADLSDPSGTNEVLCAARFDRAAKKVLRKRKWNCLATLAVLEESDSTPEWGYSKAFSLPSDYLYLKEIRLGSVWLNPEEGDYKIVGSEIHTDYDSVSIVYIPYPTVDHSSTNDAAWSAYFGKVNNDIKHCVELLLADMLCYPVTRNASLKSAISTLLVGAYDEATAHDAREQGPQIAANDLLMRAR